MKKPVQLATAFVITGLLALGTGCAPSTQSQPPSDAQFQEKVRVFEADMMARLQDLETRLEMLQGHGLNLPDEAKDKWIECSDQYVKTVDRFKSDLQSAGYQTSATWIEYRENMNQQWDAVEAAFQALKQSTGKRE